MKQSIYLFITVLMTAHLTSCGSGSAGSTSGTKIVSGMDSAVSALQSAGGAMSSTAFAPSFAKNKNNAPSLMMMTSASSEAARNCTVNGDPGTDANLDGSVSDGERISVSSNEYAIKKLYCSLVMDTNGPEGVSGAVKTIKTVICAIEKQLGGINFDGPAVPVTSITIDRTCASQAMLDDMGAGGGASTTLPVSATISAERNPTFSEIPSNTHYTHGIKIDGGSTLTFVVLAKFIETSGSDPLETGDFEFATYGTGTMMQGAAIENTAAKITRSGSGSGHLWYEFRANRAKSSPSDPICPATTSNCGWARHVRFSTDVTFASDGSIQNVSNFSGIIADGSNATGVTGGTDNMQLATVQGSSTATLVGKTWAKTSSPVSLSSVNTLADAGFTIQTPGGNSSCMSAGSDWSSVIPCSNAALEPTGAIKDFFLPANSATWFTNLSTSSGLGYSGSTDFTDGQYGL